MDLPDEIDPKTPIGEFTEDQIISIAATLKANRQWANTSSSKRKAFGAAVSAGVKSSMTAEQRRERAAKAGRAKRKPRA